MLHALTSYLSRTSCFLCGGGDNPSKVCPACLQVHMLNDDLRDFVLALTEQEMEQSVAMWGNSKTFFMGEDYYGMDGCE